MSCSMHEFTSSIRLLPSLTNEMKLYIDREWKSVFDLYDFLLFSVN